MSGVPPFGLPKISTWASCIERPTPLAKSLLLTTVYNCAQIKLTTPRYGGSLMGNVVEPTGDRHDQEQDSEYHTRISKPRKVHSRHRDYPGHSQEHGAQIPAPPGTGRHAPSASQSPFQA